MLRRAAAPIAADATADATAAALPPHWKQLSAGYALAGGALSCLNTVFQLYHLKLYTQVYSLGQVRLLPRLEPGCRGLARAADPPPPRPAGRLHVLLVLRAVRAVERCERPAVRLVGGSKRAARGWERAAAVSAAAPAPAAVAPLTLLLRRLESLRGGGRLLCCCFVMLFLPWWPAAGGQAPARLVALHFLVCMCLYDAGLTVVYQVWLLLVLLLIAGASDGAGAANMVYTRRTARCWQN